MRKTRVGCASDCGCAKQKQRVGGMVVGADSGVRWGTVDAAVRRLDGTLRRVQRRPPEWTVFFHEWQAEGRRMSGPQLVAFSERLARLAEKLGGAADNRSIVGFSLGNVSALWGGNPNEGRIDMSSPEARTGRDIDDAVSSVISAIAPVLPYGPIIEEASRVRREAMYGVEHTQGVAANPPPPTPAVTAVDNASRIAAKVRQWQGVVRDARKGYPQAQSQLVDLRRRAKAGDAAARKDARVALAVRREDNAKIRALYEQRMRAKGAVL